VADDQKADDKEQVNWTRMAGVGIEFAVAIGLFTVIGYLIDRWLGSKPWGVIVGAAVGFAVGLRALVKIGMKQFK
jgi:F0F1-type ATP synthase assembly protein I